MTQIMAKTTTLLDGRKTVKMTGRVYLRAIVPIGAFFSLSLICGNLTYLYLSVSFIQMLKVRFSTPLLSPSADFQSTGYNPRRSSPRRLVPRNRKAGYQEVGQRIIHCHWCCFGIIRRDRICSDWFPLPNGRNRLRGCPNLLGSKAAQRIRVQDGPIGLFVLLCPSLRRHELDSRSYLGGPQGHNG